MTIPLPNASEPAVGTSGAVAPRWYEFLSRVASRLAGPAVLPAYTVAQLPATSTDGTVVFASDAAGGGVPVYSRGGDWLRLDDNTEVT